MSNRFAQPQPHTNESPQGSTTHTGNGYYRGTKLANWGQRVCSSLLDYGLFTVSLVAISWIPDIGRTLDGWVYDLVGFGDHFESAGIMTSHLLNIAAVFTLLFNVVWMQGRTGRSFGKLVMGIHMIVPTVDPKSGRAFAQLPSVGRQLFRFLWHSFDLLLLPITLIKMLAGPRRWSFGDSMARTLCIAPGQQVTVSKKRGVPDFK